MTVPTAALRRAREKAGINQGEMAKLLGVSSNSVVSRLEKTEITDQSMAERYLKAIGTDESLAMLEFYSKEWVVSKQPDFRHPDKEMLWAAELALQDLVAFEAASGFDELLRAPLNIIRTNLLTTAEYVGRTDHGLAWIGTVGIGKTTALSHLTNLVLPGLGGAPRPIFPASGGRTTTSEVVVRSAPAFSISVDPRSADEVRQLVRETVDALAEGKPAQSTEIDRAIRNMAELQKRKNPDDPKSLIDPIKEMLAAPDADQDDIVHAIVNRMRLDERTETQLMLPESDATGLEWVAKTTADINFGRDARFTLPDRVTVFVPRSTMRKSAYDLTLVDTKGILGTTDREDLQKFLADPRTVSILCCSFNSAPGQEILQLLIGLKELGIDAVERQRVIILALPRADEALKVIDGLGDPVETVAEGYAVRTDQIEETLRDAGLDAVPVVYFNVADNGAAEVWNELSLRVDHIRLRQLERLNRFVEMAHELRTNADAHRIQQARVTLAEQARAMADDYDTLPGLIRPAHQRLVKELGESHPSTIAAAAARQGSWYNLDMHHMIGAGVRADANLRSDDFLKRIRGRLDGLRSQFSSTPEAVALVETLADELGDWRQEFLSRAASIGRNTFSLDEDLDFWAKLARRYGRGKGYRDEIAGMVQEWFDSPERNSARAKVEARLADAWRELVLANLIARTAISEDGAD